MTCPDSSGCAHRGSGRNPAALQQREAEEHGGISPNPTRFSIYMLPLSLVLPPCHHPCLLPLFSTNEPISFIEQRWKAPLCEESFHNFCGSWAGVCNN